MKIVRNTPEQLIVEERPWFVGVMMVLFVLIFTAIALFLVSEGQMFGLVFLVGSALGVLGFVVFVRRVQVVFNLAEGWAEIRRKSVLGQKTVRHDLAEIASAGVQETRGENGRLYRVALHIPEGPSKGWHPLTLDHSSGRARKRAAQAINTWLESARARPARRESAPQPAVSVPVSVAAPTRPEPKAQPAASAPMVAERARPESKSQPAVLAPVVTAPARPESKVQPAVSAPVVATPARPAPKVQPAVSAPVVAPTTLREPRPQPVLSAPVVTAPLRPEPVVADADPFQVGPPAQSGEDPEATPAPAAPSPAPAPAASRPPGGLSATAAPTGRAEPAIPAVRSDAPAPARATPAVPRAGRAVIEPARRKEPKLPG